LTRLIGWLGQRGMKAIIDLHAFPGGAANGQSFNGKNTNGVHAFEPANLQRGTQVLLNIAQYIKNLETDPDNNKRGVVSGIEPMNEPDGGHSQQARDFYAQIVPKLRAVLPASRYSIPLSFMDSPGGGCSWLQSQKWSNVIYDHHLYHAYGDDTSDPDTNYCKTCCRDRAFIQPCFCIDMMIGEWACTTNTQDSGENKQTAFLSKFWSYQISSYQNYPNRRGFFFWTFKLGPKNGEDTYYLNFDLIKLIDQGIVTTSDNTTLCPGEDVSKCPTFTNPQWNSPCTWK